MKFLCIIFFFISIAAIIALNGCNTTPTPSDRAESVVFYPSSKPHTRWWWFATEIKKPDVKHQLDWAKEMNFGGVEIAWVYPLYRYQAMYQRNYNRHYPIDTTAQEWLSLEWSEMVAYTKSYADSIGLACDFTFGSAWPVAGSNITKEYRTKIYGDTSFQQLLTFSWEYPDTLFVINHLDSNAFYLFADPIGHALQEALQGSKSALFTDSWEIKLNASNKIWTPGFEATFKEEFGYDVIPYMEEGIDSFPDVRYDYMLHLDEYVINGFYKPYVKKCKELGAWSRVQCLSSPTDVMTTYALVDIPETEAMLNNPNYSRIVSSSACLASKRLVSSETFTCMYGFPATYLRQEQTADLKMIADALFAQGVNHHVYHGVPYNPQGSDTIDFFATTYFGPGGSLTPELPAFNNYIEKVSGIMKKGRTYSDVAVYIPYEDGVMKGAYPPERQRVWVWGEYELRFVYPPKETEGYHPLWINRSFLTHPQPLSYKERGATHPQPLSYEERGATHPDPLLRREGRTVKLKVGDAEFSVLYIDVEYMDVRALRRILQLAKEGLPVCLKRSPKQPGKMKSEDYTAMLNELTALENVSENFNEVIDHPPLIQGDSIPEYWCRVEEDGTHYIFLAQYPAKDLMYPIYSGQSFMQQSDFRELTLNINGKSIMQTFEFKPYQSLLLKIAPNGKVEFMDISFVPMDPVVREREEQRMYF